MIAFDVSLNGKHLAVAGADDLCVLSLLIDAIGKCGPDVFLEHEHEAETHITFAVGGLRSSADSKEEGNVDWVSTQRLMIGDIITVKIVETDAPSQFLSSKPKFDETKRHSFIPTQLLGLDVKTKSGRHHVVGRKDLFQFGFNLSATGILGATSLGVDWQRDGKQGPKSTVSLGIIGVTKQRDRSKDEYLYWSKHENVEIGEEFTITVIETDKAHDPLRTEPKGTRAG